METVKDVLSFCNAAIFYDYKNTGIIDELNPARKCLFNNFYETIPVSRILKTLSIKDDVILQIKDNDIENFIENFHDLRANIIYMIAFEKVVKDDVNKVMNWKDNLLMNLVICYLSM